MWLLTLFFFLTACWWSIQSALGDYFYSENTLNSLRRAVALEPGNASYHALLAEHMEGAGLDPDAEFLRAATLSPMDSAFWIRLGFRAEVQGNNPLAEEYLMRAATVDRKFNPRWALMNYYYRRGSSQKFWYWASRSMEMSQGDVSPVFKLMWDMTQDGKLIAEHIPPAKDTLIGYLEFLTANHPDAAQPVALQTARLATARDVPALEDYCEKVLASDIPAALAVWNIACERKLLPFLPLNPQQGEFVTNGNFLTAPGQRVFDWRTPPSDGVSLIRPGEPGNEPRSLAIRLADEPEDCILLSQILPLTPNLRYRIRYEYRWTSDHPLRGMQWQIMSPSGDRPLTQSPEFAPPDTSKPAASKSDTSGDDSWKADSFAFAAPGTSARLILHYKRPLGSPLADGAISIRRVTGAIETGAIEKSAHAAERGAKQFRNSSAAAARSESVVREFPGR